jgi:mannose-6-phosphate isomerase-like protein (cupin superfamily)
MVNLRKNDQVTPANMHPTTAEFYIIRAGSATLVTGGTLMDPVRIANGDYNGSGVKGGERRPVKSGDAVLIPAGVPHTWANIEGSIEYYNVRFLSK